MKQTQRCLSMKSRNNHKRLEVYDLKLKPVMLALMLLFTSHHSFGQLPTGGQVVSGNASISQNENTLNIQQQSNNLGVHWQTFNIGAGKTVNFNQPNRDSIAYNRVLGNTRSEIYGTLNANGKVFFSNPSGFLFSPSSVVNVGSIIASTRNLSDDDFIKGNYTFSGNSDAELIFQGNLRADNGNVVLLANKVKNTGNIRANRGKVVLAAADTADISLDQDSRVNVRLSRASIDALVENRGLIAADGGQVVLTARGREMATKNAIWNLGTLQAKSLDVKNGEVILDSGNSSDSGNVQVVGKIDVSGVKGGDITITGEKISVNNSVLDASGLKGGGKVLIGGDWQGRGVLPHAKEVSVDRDSLINVSATEQGSGGKAVLWSTEKTQFSGSIAANAAKQGDGGQVETSSKKILNVDGKVEARAQNGKNGQWLLDPTDLWIVAQGGGTYSTGSTVTNTTIQNTLNTGTDVTLTTTSTNSDQGKVTILANIDKSAGSSATLNINADNDINIAGGIKISSSSNELNINLNANNQITLDLDASNPNIATTINNNGGATSINAGKKLVISNTNFTNSSSINLNSTGGNIDLRGVVANVSNSFTAKASDATNGKILITNNLSTTGGGQLNLVAANNLDLGQKIINSSGDIVLVAGNGTAAGTTTGGTVSNLTGSSIVAAAGKSINISSAGSSTDIALAEQLRNISQIGGSTVTTGTLNYNVSSSTANKGTAPLNIYLRDNATATIAAARKYDGTTNIKSTDITSKTLENGSKDDRIVEDGSVVVQIDNKNAGSRGISSVKVINDYFTGGVNGYSVADTSSATITPRDVTITAVNKDKVYDGNTSSDGVVVVSGDGFVTNEATTSQSYTDKNVAAGIQVINPNYELAANTVEGNYVINKVSATGSITPKNLIAKASDDTKVYDGNATSKGTVVFTGFVAGEGGSGVQVFNSANVVSANKTEVIALQGNDNTDLMNYSIIREDGVGAITKRQLNAIASDDRKTYDGTNTSSAVAIVTNFVVGEGGSATQIFKDYHAGVTNTEVDQITYNANTLASNYNVNKVLGNAQIDRRRVTIRAGNDSKTYDGTNTANTGRATLDNFVASDAATATQVFNDSHVRTTSKTIVSQLNFANINARASDYDVSLVEGTGQITPRQVNVIATNEIKKYDGTTESPSKPVVENLLDGDSLIGLTQSYDNAAVGMNRTLTPSYNGLSSAKYASNQSDYNFKLQENKSAMIVENPDLVKQNTTNLTSTLNNSDTEIIMKSREIISTTQLLEARTQLYSTALHALEENPTLATVKDCSTNLENCIATPLKNNTGFGEPRIKNRIALMIGIDEYTSPIPDLSTPINDIREVGASLNRNYGYEVKQLRNATKKSILSALNDLILNTDPQDSIVLMYAGHGIQKKGKAYWIPSDATFDKPDNWIDHEDVNRALSRIPSRQILLISDSCYSGALTKEFQVDTMNIKDQSEILLRRSVMVMSSGNIEPVADDGVAGHSIFAGNLINSIKTGATNLRFGSQVFQEISKKVEKATGQSPQYGAAVSAGYMQGGEFIFVPEETSAGPATKKHLEKIQHKTSV